MSAIRVSVGGKDIPATEVIEAVAPESSGEIVIHRLKLLGVQRLELSPEGAQTITTKMAGLEGRVDNLTSLVRAMLETNRLRCPGELLLPTARATRIEAWRKLNPKTRGRQPVPGLSNESINKCLKVLAQVLDDAIDFGHIESNVARGKKRRLKAIKPKRTWLELHEVQALLEVAGDHRALLATMILAGLRVGELCQLRWRDVDLAGGKLRVVDAKTEAGERVVDLTPMLLDELKLHRADSGDPDRDALVFATNKGTARDRSNITHRVLGPAIERANVKLVKAGRPSIEGVTNYSLRRTFCALLYESGESPAYVMEQMGHTDASLALEVYAKVINRKRNTGARMDALIRGADWAATGSNGSEAINPASALATESPG